MPPAQTLPHTASGTVSVTRESDTRTPSLRNRTLEEKCKAVVDHVRFKTEVSLDDFIETFVPNVLKNLSIAPVLYRMQKIEAWKELSSSPSADASSESRYFLKQLTCLFDKMVEAARNVWNEMCPEQQWSLVTEPAVAPNTPERPSTIKPDAFFYHKAYSHLQSYSYYDIAFTAEFMRSETANSLDHISRVVYAMQHIMAVDARRRFVFGIAIENMSLVLWYANRSILVASKPLDIIQDKERLLKVLLSFAFASDEDMGWDPSIELLKGAEHSFYHIMVGNTKYKTLKILQDGTDNLLSRGARIFKVKKVDDTEDKICVLKDIWLEKDQNPEHETYEKIISDIGCLYSEKGVNTVKQHLLTPVNSAFVKVNGIREDTETSMMWSHKLESMQQPILTPFHNPTLPTLAHPISSHRGVEPVCDAKSDSDMIHHRWHYRIVFKEYARPIDQVKTMGDVFTVLADIIEVFQFIHGSGWVHRDISVGNMYLYEGRGVLGDLEFAKTTVAADSSQHDIQMGTINFMPVEVLAMQFLFCPPVERCRRYRSSSFDSYEAFEQAVGPEVELPFRYNAIHDIESAWWVGIWMMFFFKPRGYTETKEASLKRQRFARVLFPGTLIYETRLVYFERPNDFLKATNGSISKKFLPAVRVFDNLRKSLLEHYRKLEETFPDGFSKLSGEGEAGHHGPRNAFPGGPPDDIHTPIKELFLKMKEKYSNLELEGLKKDANSSKMSQQMWTRSPGEWRISDDRAADSEEVEEGKGKKRKRRGT